jgi:hypothetical protein
MNIGIVDFDLLSTKKLCAYNFGVLAVSSYYKIQGVKVRLIINLEYDNLIKYDKIYIFKDYKTKIYPINFINNYYSLPIEEYGEGFKNRPLLPDLKDIVYTQLKTDVYQPLIYYIKNGGKQFSLDDNWIWQYQAPIKFFYEKDGEILLRQDTTEKRLLVYDDPLIFFTTQIGIDKMTEISKRCIIRFVKPLRIGLVDPKWYDALMMNDRIISFKQRLYAQSTDDFLYDFILWCKTHDNTGVIKIAILDNGKTEWFIKRGGKYYGKYGNGRFKDNGKERLDDIITEKNISIRHEWFTTKRSNKLDRNDRERASEKERRRKYLPSECEKRRREYKSKYDNIRSGKW